MNNKITKTYSMPVNAKKGELVPCALCAAIRSTAASGAARCAVESADVNNADANSAGSDFFLALHCEGFNFVRCKYCGLVQRNPRLNDKEIISRYADTYGKDYLSYELANEESFLKLQLLALRDAGFFRLRGSGLKVIDIGCATGSLLNYLREKQWDVTGVEISPCAEYARNERGLDVRSVPLEDCKFPDSNFDALLASHLIEHLSEPFVFLKEAYRILKPNGRIFITTPNINGFQARLFKGRWRSAIFDHLYLFSDRTLIKMMKAAGFKIKSIHTWGGLTAGAAPLWLKKIADFLAKRFNCGDVMIVNAVKE